MLEAVADQQRLQVLLAVLNGAAVRPGELQRHLGLNGPAVSRAVRELLAADLLARRSERQPLEVVRPREVRALLRAAALLEYESGGNPEALALAQRLRRQDMALGAAEPRPADESPGERPDRPRSTQGAEDRPPPGDNG